MRFPDTPTFQGINAPSRIEVDLNDLEVDGEIPADLNGAFYRIAPDHQFPPRFADDVPFNADGTISMFRFEQGRVHLKHRYVQTERYKAERAAGRALYGKYRNPLTDDPSVRGKSRNLANTTPIVFNGMLFALREDSPPIRLDPLTLQTLGDWTFDGTLSGPTLGGCWDSIPAAVPSDMSITGREPRVCGRPLPTQRCRNPASSQDPPQRPKATGTCHEERRDTHRGVPVRGAAGPGWAFRYYSPSVAAASGVSRELGRPRADRRLRASGAAT